MGSYLGQDGGRAGRCGHLIDSLLLGDCIDVLERVQDESVDMILTDMPYGTTRLKWDSVLPLPELWRHFARIVKARGAIVLTANQPFTSVLIASNLPLYRYSWIWRKTAATGFLNSKFRPLLGYEDVCVFSRAKAGAGSHAGEEMHYFPQGLVEVNRRQRNRHRGKHIHDTQNVGVSNMLNSSREYITRFKGYPTNVLAFDNDKPQLVPTQKPVALFEYLVRTYTQPGDTVLDACIGSGTTAIACLNAGRHFIGIELDPETHSIAKKRLSLWTPAS